MVVAGKNQLPDGSTRQHWLQQAYPDSQVRLIKDIYDDDNSQAWADYTVKLLGRAPDIVFTSETYGDPWARLMGSEHMLVDLERKAFPISATQVRANALKNWRYLDPHVRAYYAKRVVVVGAESSGKTTLVKALAKHYKTSWVPEYGRFYTYGKITSEPGAAWDSSEFVFIAAEQNRLEDKLAEYSNKLLICDTDALETALWHEQYMGSWSKAVEAQFAQRNYGLYLLADHQIPYEKDDIRVGKASQVKMHQRFIEVLEHYNRPHMLVSGSPAERLKQAIKACDGLLD